MNPARPRVMFLVDGFNLYHSMERVQRSQSAAQVKWLNLTSLATDHLSAVGPTGSLAGVHYFTALAHHLHLADAGKLARHKAYVRALTATGVRVHYGHFKRKNVWIDATQAYEPIWQEKATDVGIIAELFVQAHRESFDTAVIVSGDADYAPAVPAFIELFPGKRLIFAFPFDRKNKNLAGLAPGSFTLSGESYVRHQFPEAVRLPSGKFVVCPISWRHPTPPKGLAL